MQFHPNLWTFKRVTTRKKCFFLCFFFDIKDKDKLFSSDISSRRHFIKETLHRCQTVTLQSSGQNCLVMTWLSCSQDEPSRAPAIISTSCTFTSPKAITVPFFCEEGNIPHHTSAYGGSRLNSGGCEGHFSNCVGKISKFTLVKVPRARTLHCLCSACLRLCYFVISFFF